MPIWLRNFTFNKIKEHFEEVSGKKKEQESQKLQNTKADIGWGHQIRSYILHPYRLVKDNRTNVESTNPDKVMDRQIDNFLESSLFKIND